MLVNSTFWLTVHVGLQYMLANSTCWLTVHIG